MSLETEIKNLTSALSVLTNVIMERQKNTETPEPAAKPKAKPKAKAKAKPKAVPETDTEEEELQATTMDELREALIDYRDAHGATETKKLLQGMGYAGLGAIPTSEFDAVMAALGEHK